MSDAFYAEDAGLIFCCRTRAQQQQTPPQPFKIVLLKSALTALEQSFAALKQKKTRGRVGDRACDIAKSTHEPQAHRRVAGRIMTDLLESQIEQSFKLNPGNHDAQHMRRIVVVGCAELRG